MSVTAYVFADGPGGPPVPGRGALPERPGRDDVVIAADGGLRAVRALGWPIHAVVGDLDSVAPGDLDAAAAAGARVERHPVDKDATDLELALADAVAAGAERVVVLGSAGGRLDHLLGIVAVLCGPATEGRSAEARLGDAHIVVVRPGEHVAVPAAPGETVSLLAVHGPALGVRTHGLKWRLDGEDLDGAGTRGISNEVAEPGAWVSVQAGVVAVVAPGSEVAS
jgi:thiamine pyrophosphokinase